MKKLIFLIVMTLAIISCSSNDEEESKVDGQYVYRNDTILVAINFSNGVPNVLNAYIRGGSVCQLRNLITSGEYPQMNVSYTSYPSEKFQMAIKFSELSSFSAIVSECELEKGNWAGYYPYNIVVLPKQMNFKQDNTKLDKNGDGILDSTQGI